MMRSNPKRPLLTFIIWLLLKSCIGSVKPSICAVKETAEENLIERDQIPQQAQSDIESILEELESHGFVDPLFEGLKSGNCDIELKLEGVSVISRHKSGDCVACIAVRISEGDDSSPFRSLQTFVDPENVIVTMTASKVFNDTPGCDVTYCNAESLAELIPRHRQRVAELGHVFEVIRSQEEMLEWRQLSFERTIAAKVKRGYFTRHIPDGPDLPDIIDYEPPQKDVEKRANRYIQLMIFLVAFAITIIIVMARHNR